MRMRRLVASVVATGFLMLPLSSWAGPDGGGFGGVSHAGATGHRSAVTLGSTTARTFTHVSASQTYWDWWHGGRRHGYRNSRWFWFPRFVRFGTYQFDYLYLNEYPCENYSMRVDYAVAQAVQSALAQRGYYQGVIDGIIGPQSRHAIETFQSDQGLPVTGQIDGKLLVALRIL